MKASNADRQKRYRDRKRNARNATVAPIGASRKGKGKDYWQDGCQFIYLGNFGSGDVYAKVVNSGGGEQGQSRPIEAQNEPETVNPPSAAR